MTIDPELLDLLSRYQPALLLLWGDLGVPPSFLLLRSGGRLLLRDGTSLFRLRN